MLENLFSNVFGRPKNKTNNRTSQDSTGSTSIGQPGYAPAHMTGPFSMSTPQMPQPPNLPYPPAPYPGNPAVSSYYPSLPFSQPPPSGSPYGSIPVVPGGAHAPNSNYPAAGTLDRPHVSPLESVPFETELTLNISTNLVSLEELFKKIKKAADVVDKADDYLKSSESDYDFKIEQGLIYQ